MDIGSWWACFPLFSVFLDVTGEKLDVVYAFRRPNILEGKSKYQDANVSGQIYPTGIEFRSQDGDDGVCLEFKSTNFQTGNCVQHYVIVNDGPDEHAELIRRICRHQLPAVKSTVTSLFLSYPTEVHNLHFIVQYYSFNNTEAAIPDNSLTAVQIVAIVVSIMVALGIIVVVTSISIWKHVKHRKSRASIRGNYRHSSRNSSRTLQDGSLSPAHSEPYNFERYAVIGAQPCVEPWQEDKRISATGSAITT